MKRFFIYFFLGMTPFLFFSCDDDDPDNPDPEPVHDPTPYDLQIPQFFPEQVYIPDDNPLTEEGVKLGRYLFYDGRLAGREDEGVYLSCGHCHKQENSFEIGLPRPHPINPDGLSTPHTMLPLVNLLWNPGHINWSGSRSTIEEDVWGFINAPHEANSTPEKAVEAIKNIPMYPPMFKDAFGTEEVTFDRIAKAISQFIRTIISSNTKFDRYMRGEEQLSLSELNGFVLFTTEEGADCFHCHGGYGNPLFTTHLFYNNGKDTSFVGESDRYSVTGDETMKGAYKATTLRNIEYTGPYMHDGRFETLDEVIDFYAHELKWSPYIDPLMHHINNNGNQLNPSEKADLKAFLKTLSDPTLLSDPRYSRPEDLPDGV